LEPGDAAASGAFDAANVEPRRHAMVTESPLRGQWVYRSNALRWCRELIYTDPLAVGCTAELTEARWQAEAALAELTRKLPATRSSKHG